MVDIKDRCVHGHPEGVCSFCIAKEEASSSNSDLLSGFEKLAADFDEQAEAHFWDARKLEMKAENCKEAARKIRRKIEELQAR